MSPSRLRHPKKPALPALSSVKKHFVVIGTCIAVLLAIGAAVWMFRRFRGTAQQRYHTQSQSVEAYSDATSNHHNTGGNLRTSCPEVCHYPRTKAGGKSDGGISLSEDRTGVCEHYRSNYGYCGVTPAYINKGVDCTGCKAPPSCAPGSNTHSTCTNTRHGGWWDGGTHLEDDTCVQYVSTANHCGSGVAFIDGGVDCRDCITKYTTGNCPAFCKGTYVKAGSGTGGRELKNGVCTHYRNRDGECGSTGDYLYMGINCTGCADTANNTKEEEHFANVPIVSPTKAKSTCKVYDYAPTNESSCGEISFDKKLVADNKVYVKSAEDIQFSNGDTLADVLKQKKLQLETYIEEKKKMNQKTVDQTSGLLNEIQSLMETVLK